ncbi:MAG: PEP-CTERM sorting domain-containing protein [Gammaproteobacteria bacterium]|nr:PEP-CTERM sorting domain-containing protein [Gammaproteobacteria bacterium]
MNFKKLAIGASMAALGVGLSISAQAAVIMAFEDDDIDFVLKPVAAPANPDDRDFLIGAQWYRNVVSGPLAVGDVHVAVFEIDPHTIGGANAISTGRELTGVAVTELVHAADGAGGPNTLGSVYTFAPFSGGMNAILAIGDQADPIVDQGGAGEGAMIGMWMNGAPGPAPDRDLDINRATNPATNCTSLADCIGQASLGSLYQVDGFTDENGVVDPDNFWRGVQTAPAGGDYGAILAAGSVIPVAQIAGALSTVSNAAGRVIYQDIVTQAPCAFPAGQFADGCAHATFSGTITGGAPMINGAFGHSDLDGVKLIPEPGTLALFSIGLLGLGGFARRRRA